MQKDVIGFEEYAYVTDEGRVFTKDRYVNNNGQKVLLRGKEKKATDNGLGYLQVRFYINGKVFRKYLHRIVAEAFLPNPNNYSDVNHIDGNKSNNNINNLEWVSHQDNYKHAVEKGFIKRDSKGQFID